MTKPSEASEASATRVSGVITGWRAQLWSDIPSDSRRVYKWLAPTIALLIFIVGYGFGRTVEVPGTHEFWRIATQPAATLIAALAAIFAGVLAFATGLKSREQDREHHCSERSWSRLQWVIDKGSSTTPDTGLDEGLRDAILTEIEVEAAKLDDESLKKAVFMYSLQVVGVFATADIAE